MNDSCSCIPKSIRYVGVERRVVCTSAFGSTMTSQVPYIARVCDDIASYVSTEPLCRLFASKSMELNDELRPDLSAEDDGADAGVAARAVVVVVSPRLPTVSADAPKKATPRKIPKRRTRGLGLASISPISRVLVLSLPCCSQASTAPYDTSSMVAMVRSEDELLYIMTSTIN